MTFYGGDRSKPLSRGSRRPLSHRVPGYGSPAGRWEVSPTDRDSAGAVTSLRVRGSSGNDFGCGHGAQGEPATASSVGVETSASEVSAGEVGLDVGKHRASNRPREISPKWLWLFPFLFAVAGYLDAV